MQRIWKPAVVWILDMSAGILSVLGGLWITLFMSCSPLADSTETHWIGVGIFSSVLGVLAILSGIYALKREKRGWAVAGSICAAIGILGVLIVIILTV